MAEPTIVGEALELVQAALHETWREIRCSRSHICWQMMCLGTGAWGIVGGAVGATIAG